MALARTCAASNGGEPGGGVVTDKLSKGGAAGAVSAAGVAGVAVCALAFCDGDVQRADAAARKIPGRFRGSGDTKGAKGDAAAVVEAAAAAAEAAAAEAAATAAGSAAANFRCTLTNPCLACGCCCSRL